MKQEKDNTTTGWVPNNKKFTNLDVMKFCAEHGNKFAIKQLQDIVRSKKGTITSEIFGVLASKYVECYVHFDKVPTKILNYGSTPRTVRFAAGDIINVIFRDKVKCITHPKGYPIFVGFENGIYMKKLDHKTFVLMVVDKINNSIIMEKKSEYRPVIRYRLFIIGANCHYWSRKYELVCVKFGRKYHSNNPICIRKNMIWNSTSGNFMKVKSIENIVISDEDINKITSAIDQFINDKEAYEKYGIPYRLGILLYGEPGTGKSTLIHALALKYRRIITDITRQRLKHFIVEGINTSVLANPSSKFFVIEEIDTLLESRGEDDVIGKEQITHFIDSMGDGTILFATTNFKERTDAIDPAILRPGRFSVQIEMNRFDKDMAIKMCTKLGLEESFADRFTYPITPAELEFEITQELYKRAREEK